MIRFVTVPVLMLYASFASAHTPLKATVPAENAVLAQPPAELLLDFKGDIRLTRVQVIHGDGDPQDLDLDGQGGFISDFVFVLPDLGQGRYVITWRGLATDGHVLDGEFAFEVE